MTDPLETILRPGALETTAFPPTSRYHGLKTATMQTPDGKTVVYLRRRFVPSPDWFALLQEHTVTDDERLDNVTVQYLGDPEQHWRICDANGVMHPDELTQTTGRIIRIALPEGIPGATDA